MPTVRSGDFNPTVTIRPAPPQVTVTVPAPPAGQDGQFNIHDLATGGGGIPVAVSAEDLTGVAGASTITCTDNGTSLPVTGVSTSGDTTALNLPASPFAMPAVSADGLHFDSYPVSAADPDGTGSLACTPATPVTLPVGDTTVSCVSTDSAANTTTGSFVIRVLPPLPPPPPTTTPPPPRPRLKSVAESAKKWRTSDRLPRIARRVKHRPPIGTRFRFTLDRPAKVKLAFVRLGRHRRSMGSPSFAGHRGRNVVAFYRRLSKRARKPFGAGLYMVTITATNAGGTSPERTLYFIIL